jgi:hypothetical protein
MRNYRPILWLNTLFLVIALIFYSQRFGPSVSSLFLHPPFSPYFNVAILTHTFQILCSIPPILCGFSFALLRKIQPHSQKNNFILWSTFLTAGFLINEIYRVHVLLGIAGIPKLLTIFVYATFLLIYSFVFKQRIQETPYLLLLISIGLLLIGIIIDSLKLPENTLSSLLEGVPKLFSEINISLYFWYVCYQAIMRSFYSSQQ